MKKAMAFCLMALFMICLCSCGAIQAKYERINQIAPEVDYGYITYDDTLWSRNYEHVFYTAAASELLGVPTRKLSYPYRVITTDNYVYYLIEYGNHGRGAAPFLVDPEDNLSTFDIGLFRIAIETGVTEWLHDFKDVYPRNLYTYTMENVYSNVVDDQTLLFFYNGKIELFDLETKTVVITQSVHEPDQYRNAIYYPYRANPQGDVYAIIDGTLRYYLNRQSAFDYYEFPAGEAFYADRYGDYVILSSFTNQAVYHYAYRLLDGTEADLATALAVKASIEAMQAANHPDPDEFTASGIRYEYNLSDRELVLYDRENLHEYRLDIAIMTATNQAFRDIVQLWNPNPPTELVLEGVIFVDGSLFVGFTPSEYLGNHPTFLFEYDFLADQTKYVGYHYSGFPSHLILLRDLSE